MAPNPGKLQRIAAYNARTWKNAELRLHPGLNVVVGSSDAGKSNLVRTVLSVVQNATADAFVAKGVSGGEAVLEFDDGHTVKLTKGPKVNAYETGVAETGVADNNAWRYETFADVGLSVPQAVREVLNFGPVRIADDDVQLNVQTQRGPVLIVDDTPARVARIVGSVSGLDAVHRAVADAARAKTAADKNATQARAVAKDAVAGYKRARSRFDASGASRALARAEAAQARLDASRGEAAGLAQTRQDAAGAIDGFRVSQVAANAVRGRETALAGVLAESVSAGDRLGALYRIRRSIIDASAGYQDAVSARAAGASAYRDAQARYDDAVAELDACPVCGREMKGAAAHAAES